MIKFAPIVMKIHDSFRVFSLFEIWYVVITNLISLAALCFCAIWNSISQPLRLEIKVCSIVQIGIILVVLFVGFFYLYVLVFC